MCFSVCVSVCEPICESGIWCCRFIRYQNKSVSIHQVLQLTLDFASDQGSAVRQERVGGERGGEVRGEGGSQAGTGEKYPRMSVGPEPRYVSPEERATLEQCLGRWKREVEEDIAGLQTQCN